jgi:signal transduction histidine kinase
LTYGISRTCLSVENEAPVASEGAAAGDSLRDAGGGRGLTGLSERFERVSGRITAGPTDAGWRVDMEVPA